MENWMRTRLDPSPEQLNNRPTEPTVVFVPGFFTEAESKEIFEGLHAELSFAADPVQINGQIVHSKRQSDYRGDPGAQYAYSGVDRDPKPWTPTLRAVKDRLEARLALRDDVEPSAEPHSLSQENTSAMAPKAAFNAVLCNYYEDGSAGMGWHADKEADLGPRPLIASLSFGAARPFKFRFKKHLRRVGVEADETVWEWVLKPGDLLLMQGETQIWFEHHLPPRAGVKEPRINLTFRKVVIGAARVDDALAGEAWRQSQALKERRSLAEEPAAKAPAGVGLGGSDGAPPGGDSSAPARPAGRFMPNFGARRPVAPSEAGSCAGKPPHRLIVGAGAAARNALDETIEWGGQKRTNETFD